LSEWTLEFRCGEVHERFYIAREARRFAARAGLGPRACSELGVGVAELVSNVARHAAGDGFVRLRLLDAPEPCIELVVHDAGPGIADFECALRDGFSRGRQRLAHEQPKNSESLGLGLGAVARLMDEIAHVSDSGPGTTIRAIKRLTGVRQRGSR
jgi:serine/threonine-protein kinase RsbT